MTARLPASIFAYRMGFSVSLAGVIRSAAPVAIAALFAAHAAAEVIPGPPIGAPSDRAGAFCALDEDARGSAVTFAAGVAIVAITGRRRGRANDA